MKKILYINTVCGFSSTGNIVAELSKMDGFESLVCYGRKKDYVGVNSYKFANLLDNIFGALGTILFDNNLNICSLATKRLIKKIKEFNPDVINIHNLHGYYVNVEMLFKFLKEFNKPVVMTLHDAWTMTGYCPHFDGINCKKYQTKCENCEYGFSYPFSLFKQNVKKDYDKKKELFNSLNNLIIATPSKWLKDCAKNSFLSSNRIEVINNGIDFEVFNKTLEKETKFTIISVANVWTKEKGLDELNKIIPLLDDDINVIVVGKNSNKVNNATTINRTSNTKELADLYSKANLFVNPTLQETFGLVNVEANACGTPVITYKTGGSPETINEESGIVVEKYDYKQMAKLINDIKNNNPFDEEKIINSSKRFNKVDMFNNYKKLFESL